MSYIIKKSMKEYKIHENIVSYSFLTPSLIILTIFLFIPIICSLGLMFYDWEITSLPKYVGLKNFEKLLNDELFHKAIFNTIYFVVGSVPLSVFPALSLAWIFNQKWFRGGWFFEAVYFIPVVCGWVEVAMIWRFLLDSKFGLINYILEIFGLPGQKWLVDPNIVMISIILVHAWKLIGYNTIIFHSALSSIPLMYYEAAELDGASPIQTFRHVIIPLLVPILFFVLTINTIWSFYVFPQVYVLTQGGPSYASYTIVFYLYYYAFKHYKMSYAAAVSIVLFALISIFTYVQRRIFAEEVKY
ncbi:MAG: sugar ABC transporter permease [Candidatus Methanomethylicaceae archaeon]